MTGILTRLKFLEDDLFKNSFENEQVWGGGGMIAIVTSERTMTDWQHLYYSGHFNDRVRMQGWCCLEIRTFLFISTML